MLEYVLGTNGEAFCDSHCTWLDHHPDCLLPGQVKAASPVQGAASASYVGTGAFRAAPDGSATQYVITDLSGEAKSAASATDQGAAVKPWQLRVDWTSSKQAVKLMNEAKTAEIADWRALAERAQAAQPSGAVAAAFKELVGKNTHRRPRIVGNEVEYRNEIDTYQIGRDAIDIAYGKANLATPAPEQEAAPTKSLYVEARECGSCLHVGINDSSNALAACHNCDWSGPSPVEGHCPGCADSGCMGAACPKCGAIYKLLAETTLAAPVEQEAAQVGMKADPVPAGIYYSKAHDNFYHMLTYQGQGGDFYGKWIDRRAEFPQSNAEFGFGPVAQEAEQPQGDVMRPFGAPAGQHDSEEAAWEARKHELRALYPGIAGDFTVVDVVICTETGCVVADGEYTVAIARIVNGFLGPDDFEKIEEAIAEEIADAPLFVQALPEEGSTSFIFYESGEREDVFWNKFYRRATATNTNQPEGAAGEQA